MGMESLPVIPDLAVVAQAVQLSRAYEAERYDQRPASWPTYRLDELEPFHRPMPARADLLNYLRSQSAETLSGLYGLYKVGDLAGFDAAGAADCYRDSFDLAMKPIHSAHGAADLVAKSPLAERILTGLERLGLTPVPPSSRPGDHLHPVTQLEG